MCLHLGFRQGILTKIIVPCFSSFNIDFEEKISISQYKANVPNTFINKSFIVNKSPREFESYTYSACRVDNATSVCNLETQSIRHPEIATT